MGDSVIHNFLERSLRLKEEGNTLYDRKWKDWGPRSSLTLSSPSSLYVPWPSEGMEWPEVGVKVVLACLQQGC